MRGVDPVFEPLPHVHCAQDRAVISVVPLCSTLIFSQPGQTADTQGTMRYSRLVSVVARPSVPPVASTEAYVLFWKLLCVQWRQTVAFSCASMRRMCKNTHSVLSIGQETGFLNKFLTFFILFAKELVVQQRIAHACILAVVSEQTT